MDKEVQEVRIPSWFRCGNLS